MLGGNSLGRSYLGFDYYFIEAKAITKSLKYTVKAPGSPITKSLRYAVKTTPAVIKKIVHVGSQSQDMHANTQEQTDGVITALTTTIPNLTHIAIGTYLDYGVASSVTGSELDVVFPDAFV